MANNATCLGEYRLQNMASNNRKKLVPETAQVVNNLEVGSTTSNHIKTITNTKNQKEVTVKLDNNKTLHIVHLDPQTVVINGRPFKRELVNYYLDIHKQEQQERKQQVNAKIRDLLKRKIKQDSRPTSNSTPISLVNGSSVNHSLLRTQLLTPNNKSQKPPVNKDEEALFNGNHSNSEGIKFLQDQFKSNPTLQSILAEIATLQKEYNDLDANLLDKEVEAMREKNSLPSMVDLDLFKGKQASKNRAETIVRPSTSRTSKPIPELVPVNGSKQVPRSNEIYSPGKLVIDEDATYEPSDLIKPEATKSRNLLCQFCKVKLKTKAELKRHLLFCTMKYVKEIEKSIPIEPVSPSPSSSSASSFSDFKIAQVFANGKKIVSCDRCNFEATEDEVAKHASSHFKKAKETRRNNLYSKSDKHLCGGDVKIKTEPIDYILIDDDD